MLVKRTPMWRALSFRALVLRRLIQLATCQALEGLRPLLAQTDVFSWVFEIWSQKRSLTATKQTFTRIGINCLLMIQSGH